MTDETKHSTEFVSQTLTESEIRALNFHLDTWNPVQRDYDGLLDTFEHIVGIRTEAAKAADRAELVQIIDQMTKTLARVEAKAVEWSEAVESGPYSRARDGARVVVNEILLALGERNSGDSVPSLTEEQAKSIRDVSDLPPFTPPEGFEPIKRDVKDG